MKDVAVIICNFNKKDYLVKCLASLQNSSYTEFDIYVVDNASTDGSVSMLEEEFEGMINLIKNTENIGGSGGFNTGMRIALEKDYKYLYLLDNDVVLERNALQELYLYAENNNDVGMLGSVIYSMDNPEQIQEIGSIVDWDKFQIKLNYRGYKDNDGLLPEVVDCDYVAVCSALISVAAVRKVGLMDANYFIYWDDIEWGHRMKLAGYRVAANAKSKVWHKTGVSVRTDTFATYYFWRNRVQFFVKYLAEKELEIFAWQLFTEVFQAVYSCNYTGKFSSAKSIVIAVADALSNVQRKAAEGRIHTIEAMENKLEKTFKDKESILIFDYPDIKVLRDIIKRVREVSPKAKITLVAETYSPELLISQFIECRVTDSSTADYEDFDLSCEICSHIFDVRNNLNDKRVYIDGYFNLISTKEDREIVQGYDRAYELHKNIYFPLFLAQIKVLHYKISQKIR
jgi:hypothetical protein